MEKLKMDGVPSDIHGRVKFEYLDPVTEKVKELYEHDNHVFVESFLGEAWFDILTQTAAPQLIITDDDTEIDPQFPYLRGNIIGTGLIGALSNGTFQGSHVASLSELGVPNLTDGLSYKFKYVYDFYPSQLLDPVPKCIGLTAQYMNLYLNSGKGFNFPVKKIPYQRSVTLHHTTKGQKGYRITNAGVVTIYNPFFDTETNIDISSLILPATTLSIGVDVDPASTKIYVFAYSATAAERKMYVFSDDLFTNIEQTYDCSNIATYPSTTRVFLATANGKMLYWNSGWMRANFMENVNSSLIPIGSDVLNTAIMSGQVGNLLARDGLCYMFNENYATSVAIGRSIILNPELETIVATLSTGNKSTSGILTYQQCFESPLPDRSILLANTPQMKFYLKQALTAYLIPEDAPARPDGTTMRITYQLDVTY